MIDQSALSSSSTMRKRYIIQVIIIIWNEGDGEEIVMTKEQTKG